MSPVALVLVSHSDTLARGVAELAKEMAPDVHIGIAGGLPGGGLGTSFDLVEAAVSKALDAATGAGVVLLTDLGSATLTVDMVIEFAENPDALILADGPLVEGAVAAAVAAQQGQPKEGVANAVTVAGRQWCGTESPSPAETTQNQPEPSEDPVVTEEALVTDPAGMHARPAAQIAALATTFDAEVTIDGVSATSMLELMSLGASQGSKVEVSATGTDAVSAVRAVANAITRGFEAAPTEA